MGGGREGEVTDAAAHERLLGKEPAPQRLVDSFPVFDLRGGEERRRGGREGGRALGFVVEKEVVDEEGGTLGVEGIELESDHSLIISIYMQRSQKQKNRPRGRRTRDPLGK